MAFDLSTAQPVRKKFDIATAKPLSTIDPTVAGIESGLQASGGLPAAALAETALAVGSAAIAEPVAGLAGIAASILPGEPGAGVKAIEAAREALTFKPRLEASQEFGAQAAEVLAPVGEAIAGSAKTIGDVGAVIGAPIDPALGFAAGSAVPAAAGIAVGAPRFFKPSPTKQRITKLIEEGSTDIEPSRFILKDGALKTDKTVKEATRQGFDEGVIADVKASTPETKTKMRQMVDIMERGKKNKRFAVTNRPGDIAGDSILDRFRVVKKANRAAGKQLDGVANSLRGKDVDSSLAVNEFIDDLDSMGITIGRNLKPRFRGSDIEGLAGPEAAISRIVSRMAKSKAPDAFELHRLKRFIDETVTFGKQGEGLSGRVEGILKNLRRNLDQTLDSNFPAYDKVNTSYSETIRAIDSLQDVAGKKMNLTTKNADKAVGTLLRRLMSNAQSRVPLLDSIQELELVARKHGGTFKDDLLSQALFVDELDAVFKPVARTSFQGQIGQALESLPQQQPTVTGLAVTAAKAGAKKLQGINEQGAFKSIKDLLK